MKYREIAALAWPLALGMLNNAILQFVDGVFLARESMHSLAASLPASMLALALAGFFQSVVVYSGTFVAQYAGAGSRAAAWKSYRAGTAIAVAAGALCAATIPLGLAIAPWMSESAEVVARARSYYAIVSAGSVALCGQMAAAAFFTAYGRTRTVFWTNLLGNALNAILDPILIFGFAGIPALGMDGAAYATVAAAFVQWAVLARMAARMKPSAAETQGEKEDGGKRVPGFFELSARILRYGVPSGAYSALNVASFTIFVFATGMLGEADFAVSNACFKVNYLLIAPMEGFAVAASTVVARFQGMGDADGAARNALKTLVLGLCVVVLLSVGAVVFREPVLRLFSPPGGASGEAFVGTGSRLFVLMAVWQVFDAADVILSGALKGAGDTRFVFRWMAAAAFGFWLPLVGVVCLLWPGICALWGTMVVYVAVICAGTSIRFARGAWRRHRLV